MEVFDVRTLSLLRTIDVEDRLFGGIVLAPDGTRAYALMRQTALPPHSGTGVYRLS